MDFNKQTSHNVGHCFLYGCKLGIAWSSTRFQWGLSPVLFPFLKLINDDMSTATILEQGWLKIWRTWCVVLSLPTVVYSVLQRIMLPQNARYHSRCNQHLRPVKSRGRNRGTTYHAWRTSYSWLRCIHQQSRCERPHQFLASPWARSAIWRECKHGHWDEPETSKRGHC